MGSLIETFHIDWRILTAQAINFAIVFFVLYFFALKPLAKIMRERTKKIEKSLEDAKKIEDNLAKTEEKYNKKMSEAKIQANELIKKAKELAEIKKQDMIVKAKKEIGGLINQEKEKMQIEKGKILKEIKKQTADLVAISLEKILEEKIDKKQDMKIIKKIVK